MSISLTDDVFPGTSEMARRMRELDWSRTPLGPVEQWPQSLRTSVSTCLDCAFPIILWWGPELTVLYNDEYAQILSSAKHPAALGQPGSRVWAEIWDVIEPMLAQVLNQAIPTRSRDLLLHIDRGYVEEAYFSFSYSPIHAENGKVGGIFCPVIETTEKVIGERRLRTLRDLAARCKGAENEQSVYDAAASVLGSNSFDVPFALFYRVEEQEPIATLMAAAGIAPGSPAAPERVALGYATADPWSLTAVARSGWTTTVTDLWDYQDVLPTGVWRVPPKSAMVLPVLLPGQDRPRGILVSAVSPMRALDEDYRTFFTLVATQIASALADTQALEEERRRAEALAELDRAKTAFFSNVSHEFRTPLTLMLGPLEDLRGIAGTLPAEAAAALDVAHRNSLRLLKLVNTLLDFSRIEAGRIDANYEPTDLAALTIELASVFRSAVEKAGLSLVVECDPLPELIFIDHDMWEKIVLNLLSNAFKFTFEGRITVALRWAGEKVELSVSDTGIGIAESDLPRMFQRFHRVRHARARTHEGTGIGLALVQELARLHGGSVTVTSREGAGTTFTVAILTGSAHLAPERIAAPRQLTSTSLGAMPYVEEALRWLPSTDESRERHAVHPGDVPAAVRSRLGATARVLVADDNADMREYLGRMLGQVYDVETVSDGRAALERIQADPPDLVLADVMMPALDGFGLVFAIRADERIRSVPVILLSARAGEEARIEGLRAGADEYLVKPFSARELLARVASQLQLAKLRHETEAALRYRSEQHEILFSQAPIGMYLVDADLRIREINPVAAPIFGDIAGGVIDRDFGEVMHLLQEPAPAEAIVQIFRNTLQTGEPFHRPEVAAYRVDRNVTEYYEWRLARITLPDGQYGLVCYFQDISAQVQARLQIAESEQALREADRRKDEFLALLAHELRNPLAPIRTGLELIRLSGDTPQSVRQVRSLLERQVAQMVRLIDDLLDVSRITSGKIVLQRTPTVLAELVQSAIEAQRAAIDAARLELTVDLSQPSPVIDVDPTRIVQVLSNVLHNATKFTPPGGAIRIASRVEEVNGSPDSQVVITVSDNGIGISRDMLPRMFELFAQAELPTERSHGGLGIGLALARRLVDLHGGQITGHSDGPGNGSTFVITLPVSRALPQGRSSPHVDVPPVRSRVVIIDDNRDAATTMSMLVEKLGGSARIAHDGASGIRTIREFQPEMVFLDIGMPGMDGYEACRRIRQEPTQRQVIVVAVTGWGQAQDKQRALDAGFDAHLTKPVDPAALARLLAGRA